MQDAVVAGVDRDVVDLSGDAEEDEVADAGLIEVQRAGRTHLVTRDSRYRHAGQAVGVIDEATAVKVVRPGAAIAIRCSHETGRRGRRARGNLVRGDHPLRGRLTTAWGSRTRGGQYRDACEKTCAPSRIHWIYARTSFLKLG